MQLRAQGATEYLVLLAVVLIVALVSVALLGFFPGMASDAQMTQSQMYWKSAQPIAILEGGARSHAACVTCNFPYLRVKNTGAYPIRITQLLGNGQNTSTIWVSATYAMSTYYYLAPGEEAYFGRISSWPGLPYTREINFAAGSSGDYTLGGAPSVCSPGGEPYGTLVMNNFGFEYIVYIDGQQITKREIGKPLVIKCSKPGDGTP